MLALDLRGFPMTAPTSTSGGLNRSDAEPVGSVSVGFRQRAYTPTATGGRSTVSSFGRPSSFMIVLRCGADRKVSGGGRCRADGQGRSTRA